MGNGAIMTRDVVKKTCDPDEPERCEWIKFKVDESKRIAGLARNYIWKFKHNDNRSGYDTYDGYVISAPDFDSAWTVFENADNYVDDEYDNNTPWHATIIGIDISGEGNRVIESSFRAG